MKVLKIIILFVIVLSGCAKDYLVRSEEELVDREALLLRDRLDVKVVSRNNEGFSLVSQISNIAVVRDSLKIREFYEHGTKEEGGIMTSLGTSIGLGGCFSGYKYVESSDCLYYGEGGNFPEGCIISFVSILLGAAMVGEGRHRGEEFVNVLPGYIKIDTVCVDSMFISNSEVEISVEKTDFTKTYYTDENGNMELRFNEIIPEPTEADSVLNLIIQYEVMFDTVEVILDSRQ